MLAIGNRYPSATPRLGHMRAFCHGFSVEMLISFASRRVFPAEGHVSHWPEAKNLPANLWPKTTAR